MFTICRWHGQWHHLGYESQLQQAGSTQALHKVPTSACTYENKKTSILMKTNLCPEGKPFPNPVLNKWATNPVDSLTSQGSPIRNLAWRTSVWHSRQSYLLQYLHPLWAPVHILASLLSIQLPAKGWENNRTWPKCLRVCYLLGRLKWNSWFLASALISPSHCSHLEDKPASGRVLSLSFPMSDF